MIGRDRIDETASVAGYPLSSAVDPDTGYQLIELTGGGVLVVPPTEAQGFWVPPQVRDLWDDRGGTTGLLGLPTSPVILVGPSLRLEFERGFMVAALEQGLEGRIGWLQVAEEDVEITYVDPLEELAAFTPPQGFDDRVFRQLNGTAWFIKDGTRHWIRDGGTWGCIDAGNTERLVPQNVPGYVVAAIPLGDPATCPEG